MIHQYQLEAADQVTFSKYFATYYNNIWFRPSWDSLYNILQSSTDCYWIMNSNQRIGGIFMPDHSIGLMFSLPGYSITTKLVKYLKSHILSTSNQLEEIYAYNILPDQTIPLMKEGFVYVESRECMIRPTEKMMLSLNDEYGCYTPSKTNESKLVGELAEVLEEAFFNGPDMKEKQTYTDDMNYYFQHAETELLGASSIIYNKNTKEIAGLCLVSLWEGYPLIYDLAVRPKYRRSGLAKFMLNRAISSLVEKYPFIRLFVTTDNNAKLLYTQQGFLTGGETFTLKFKR